MQAWCTRAGEHRAEFVSSPPMEGLQGSGWAFMSLKDASILWVLGALSTDGFTRGV
jgi:hypothetical protein